jgi:outer membrane protein TolC
MLPETQILQKVQQKSNSLKDLLRTQFSSTRKLVWLCFCIVFFTTTQAQDSTYALSANDFLNIVIRYHPIAKQADLLRKQAKAELTIAQGNFDPTINSNYDRKTFDGSNYYSLFESEIKIPSWIGEVKAGYDYYYGININPENKIPQQGQSYFGISLPLMRDLITDKKRTALRQAKLFRDASEQHRFNQLNDLLYDAICSYYDWYSAYNTFSIYQNAVSVAEKRLEFTRKSVEFGDRAAIDTVEALTQLQTRLFELNDARTHLNNATIHLSNFLWYENDEPLLITEKIFPSKIDIDFLNQPILLSQVEEMSTQLKSNHPLLLAYNIKIQQLVAERRLKAQNVLPKLNASYNVLSRELDFFRNPEVAAIRNNYKFGVSFSMPLSFTQSRGELKLAQIKVKDAQYAFNLKSIELNNKLKVYFNELINYQSQTRLFDQTVNNFKLLLSGEEQRFRFGESSMFLVNTRESKVIESEVKLVQLKAKFYKTEAAVKWAAGNLHTLK